MGGDGASALPESSVGKKGNVASASRPRMNRTTRVVPTIPLETRCVEVTDASETAVEYASFQ